jgi:ribulose 1,5-bisphosphate synthetase/thiazole synthase
MISPLTGPAAIGDCSVTTPAAEAVDAADVVVVGGGDAGLIAAIEAADSAPR